MGAQINRRLRAPAAAPGMLDCLHGNVTKTPARGRMSAQGGGCVGALPEKMLGKCSADDGVTPLWSWASYGGEAMGLMMTPVWSFRGVRLFDRGSTLRARLLRCVVGLKSEL